MWDFTIVVISWGYRSTTVLVYYPSFDLKLLLFPSLIGQWLLEYLLWILNIYMLLNALKLTTSIYLLKLYRFTRYRNVFLLLFLLLLIFSFFLIIYFIEVVLLLQIWIVLWLFLLFCLNGLQDLFFLSLLLSQHSFNELLWFFLKVETWHSHV